MQFNIMDDQQLQKHLLYITKIKIKQLNFNKIKAVTAIWKNDTAYISIFFDKKPTEDELENVSDTCTEIIAQMPKGMIEDKYIILKASDQLPKEFLAYIANS